MENKINKDDFRFIEVAFIQKTNVSNAASVDIDGKDSLKHLQNIIESHEPMIKTICLEHDVVEHTYRNVTNVTLSGKRVLEFHFIWARMILEYYFYYHEDQEEARNTVDQMLEYEGFTYIKESVREGVRLIDEYFKKVKNSSLTKKTCAVSPDLMRVMQDINSGTRTIQDVDWEKELQHQVAFFAQIPMNIPPALWLWGLICLVDEPTSRMTILSKLQEQAITCFDKMEQQTEFVHDCDSLICINMRVRECKLNDSRKIIESWKDERKPLNDLALILSDAVIPGADLVALANALHSLEDTDIPERLPLLVVLRSFNPEAELHLDNLDDFLYYIELANGYRCMILRGKMNFEDDSKFESVLDRRLKKECFDIYIEHRLKQVKSEICNKQLDEPERLECLEELLKQEKTSAAHNGISMDDEGDVPMFLKYLDKLTRKTKNGILEANMRTSAIYIDKVDNLAMGDNVQTKIENQND